MIRAATDRSRWLRRLTETLIRRVWRRIRPATITWVDESLRKLRRDLRTRGLRARVAAPCVARPHRRTRLVVWWLTFRRATCLERSLILQRWLLEAGEPHDLLIGARAPGETAVAHAWLDHESSLGFHVLHRVPALQLGRAPVPASPAG